MAFGSFLLRFKWRGGSKPKIYNTEIKGAQPEAEQLPTTLTSPLQTDLELASPHHRHTPQQSQRKRGFIPCHKSSSIPAADAATRCPALVPKYLTPCNHRVANQLLLLHTVDTSAACSRSAWHPPRASPCLVLLNGLSANQTSEWIGYKSNRMCSWSQSFHLKPISNGEKIAF